MADGVGVTEGAGKTVATDEKNFGSGAVHVQLIGIVDARDGVTTQVGVDTATNALLVQLVALNTSGKITNVDLTQNAAAVVGVTTALTNRKAIMVINESDVTVRLGFASTVTATAPNRGIPIPSGMSVPIDLGTTPFYLFAPTGGAAGVKSVTIVELA